MLRNSEQSTLPGAAYESPFDCAEPRRDSGNGDSRQVTAYNSSQLVGRTADLTLSTDQSDVPHHVLVVEDNVINQKLLAKQLRTAGLTVDVANDVSQVKLVCMRIALRRLIF